MTSPKIKKFAAVALVILGGLMIFLGLRAGIPAPSITGVGFFIIAAVFFFD